ncbi:MAG: TetR family transcriptional regulator [Calditrichaeota bacterium]|nr:TetR family transcriptional regulator [Calditrichota bacterium]
MLKGDSTRNKIMAAAREVFVEKGYDGARMQQIADRAGANKAMIYYYFNSKDALFEAIIRDIFKEIFRIYQSVLQLEDVDLRTMITSIVHEHLIFLQNHPEIARLFLREVHSDNPILYKVMNELRHDTARRDIKAVMKKLEKAADDGIMRRVDPMNTIWNIVGLDLFYFVSKPLINVLWTKETRNEAKVMQAREESIVDLLLNGLLPR